MTTDLKMLSFDIGALAGGYASGTFAPAAVIEEV